MGDEVLSRVGEYLYLVCSPCREPPQSPSVTAPPWGSISAAALYRWRRIGRGAVAESLEVPLGGPGVLVFDAPLSPQGPGLSLERLFA